ncbi:DUF885 domain-containing protein [Hymenobacter coccineus]|uniref:DUF885 domain-containing protein n=1 Tax=Hymenobacter coccineus TaxID=1908235 RepID=A0A1G1SVP4_9BACT|nr:DUF885 domain-containing protein [Hymenobacter coccineus]OGX82686.1 hypothetical protein BEN49_13405 [Hymenobacter coccineus]
MRRFSLLRWVLALLVTYPFAPALAQKTKPIAKTTAAAAVPPAASAPLGALFAAYWDEQAKLFPLAATTQGDNRYNDQLPNDQTQAFRSQVQSFYQKYQAQLRKNDRKALSVNDQISYDILDYDLSTKLADLQQPTWMLPFTQFASFPNSMGQLGAGTGNQPFKTVQDYDNWLGRVGGFPVWADSAIGNFRRGMRAGVVLPKALVGKMIPQLESFVVTDPAKSLFYGPLTKFPATFTDADRSRLTAAYQKAISTQLVPAYARLAQFLKTEYLPQARASSGIGAVPGGPAMYAQAIRFWTTTALTPAQLSQTGLAEVKRLRAEMEKIKTQVGFQGDLPAFFTFLNTDPRFTPYKTEAEVLAGFAAIQARMAPNLPKLFGRVPRTGFEVRATEAFRAASAAPQYSRGTADGSRPGIFYVPILDATKFNTVTNSAMETLFLHEAIPGHHYQVSLQQENTALPKFRRFGSYSAFNEGWGLYTESLGRELGLYTDPYQQMSALILDIHRAIRLVTDVGLHTGTMTREEAIRYMLANEATSEQFATSEIERYMSLPGQALAYKVGQLKIRELRARYEKQLGPKFDLRAFHDEILAGGTMPLAVLERRMDAWAVRQR